MGRGNICLHWPTHPVTQLCPGAVRQFKIRKKPVGHFGHLFQTCAVPHQSTLETRQWHQSLPLDPNFRLEKKICHPRRFLAELHFLAKLAQNRLFSATSIFHKIGHSRPTSCSNSFKKHSDNTHAYLYRFHHRTYTVDQKWGQIDNLITTG